MPGKRRSRAQLTRDRRRIADLYLQGWIQADIAAELSISPATVSRDLAALRRDWLESALVDFDEAQSRELAKINRLEREYWEAWERSTGERKRTSTKQVDLVDGKRKEAQIQTDEMLGDPRFLAGVQWCIEQRMKIFGLEAARKLDLSSAGRRIAISEVVVNMAQDERESVED